MHVCIVGTVRMKILFTRTTFRNGEVRDNLPLVSCLRGLRIQRP